MHWLWEAGNTHAKRHSVCGQNEEKPEILCYGVLYMLGYGRKYVTFSTVLKSCKVLAHHARIITYADT